MARREIPVATRQAVLLESGYRCANPVCRSVLTLEMHHILWVRDGGGNEPENLLSLCPNCHALHTSGHIPLSAIAAWKGFLLAIGNPNRAAVDFLLVLAEEEAKRAEDPEFAKSLPFQFTGDSLPFLAPLLTSGVVEITQRLSGLNLMGGAHPSFRIGLTARGRQLVAAWRSGNVEGVTRALKQEGDRGSARLV